MRQSLICSSNVVGFLQLNEMLDLSSLRKAVYYSLNSTATAVTSLCDDDDYDCSATVSEISQLRLVETKVIITSCSSRSFLTMLNEHLLMKSAFTQTHTTQPSSAFVEIKTEKKLSRLQRRSTNRRCKEELITHYRIVEFDFNSFSTNHSRDG